MDQTNRQQIEVICDRLSDLRTMASKEGNGLLAHLIAETLEEAEKLRISAMKSPALAGLAWTGKPLRCSCDKLFGIRQGPGSSHQEEAAPLVCPQRGETAVLVRWDLDELVQRAEEKGRAGASRHLCVF